MSLPVLFRPAARREFDEAADWYEQHRAGWGAKFVAAVQDVIDRAAANPRRYAKASGETREGLVRGFPYCVYYCEQDGQLIVLAVFHSSRDPSIWKGRS